MAAVLMVGIIAACLASGEAFAQNSAEPYLIEADTNGLIDLGTVRPDTLKPRIHLVNPGDRTLKLDVRTSDGGMRAVLPPDSVGPGDTVVIKLLWLVTSAQGLKRRYISIYYDPGTEKESYYNTQLGAEIRAYVRRDLYAESYAVIRCGAPGTVSSTTIELKNSGDTVFTIEAPRQVRTDSFTVMFSLPDGNRITPGGSARIAAEFRAHRDVPFFLPLPVTAGTSSKLDPTVDFYLVFALPQPAPNDGAAGRENDDRTKK